LTVEIDPFSVVPSGPLDRLTAYWWTTALRLTYHGGRLDLHDQLAALGDGSNSRRIPIPDPTGLIPAIYVADYPQGRRIVLLEGTTRPQQWALHALGSNLTVWDGAGRINAGLRAVARLVAVAAEVVTQGRTWAAGGHSFGGAIAATLPEGTDNPPSLLVDAGSPRTGDLEYASAQTVPRLRLTGDGDPVPALPPSTGSFLDELPAYVPSWFDLGPVFYRHWGSRVHLYADGSALRPAESQTVGEAAELLRRLIARGIDWLPSHRASTYAERVRQQIPVVFPAPEPDGDFPGIEELDSLNVAINGLDGIEWEATAAPLPPGALPLIVPACGLEV
jgi:hypothetical protein